LILLLPDRVNKATEKLELLHRDLCTIIELHEGNRIVNYSDKIAKQVTYSHGAWAFETMRSAMLSYEIVAICRIWDVAEDSASIPAVTKLIDDLQVQQDIFEKCTWQWPSEKRFAQSHCGKMKSDLKGAIELANATCSGNIRQRLQNLRNKSSAHLTLQTRLEKYNLEKSIEPVEPAKFGDEKVLLEQAIEIVEVYYTTLLGTSFSLRDHKSMYERRAHAFWDGVSINVLK
jgi:AbiU2